MKAHWITFLLFLIHFISVSSQNIPAVYIDKEGNMRWSDTKKEASFYGVNYTLPFAHAYRAMKYLGVDHKKAIDRDVYHMARLGLNAYRIHIWDVEISDKEGNLVENEHLDLLDYLIARLRERDIRIVITAQTNFGNGYPERDRLTDGYSYQYEKCNIHSDPVAIQSQSRYLVALVCHKNPYTGKSYKDDPYVVGFEINNEPCHSGTKEETKAYIDKMLLALKKAGNRKPVFYNASHNLHVAEAYYASDVQGTTFQWYPIGLVNGHTRKGNFLPYVDSYDIPYTHFKGYMGKARLVYEFDPADILYSYMYPAMARTFRKAGFSWITQFAYDPMDMAYANTEYQTHYLNLAYTPRKALSMKIAAEVARSVSVNDHFGTYPLDTLFGDFRVSYREDLSEMNSVEKFYYSNHTSTFPVDAARLRSIAGYGNSPVVRYNGTGAYFLDKLEDGIWRLEIMPDVVQLSDPFAKPSLQKEVRKVLFGKREMKLELADLGGRFEGLALNEGNPVKQSIWVEDGQLHNITPGVYLLSRKGIAGSDRWTARSVWQNICLGEFVAPDEKPVAGTLVIHTPEKVVEAGHDLKLKVTVLSAERPDSVVVYTDKVSFWKKDNSHVRMTQTGDYSYEAVLSGNEIKEGIFRYNVVVFRQEECRTFPAGFKGAPLDWDYIDTIYWEIRVVTGQKEILLWSAVAGGGDMECYSLPEGGEVRSYIKNNSIIETPSLCVESEKKDNGGCIYLRKYVREDIVNRKERLKNCTYLCVQLKENPEGMEIGFVTTDGYTYKQKCRAGNEDIVRVPLSKLKQTDTVLLPHAYPVFLKKYFRPETDIPFDVGKVDYLELSSEKNKIEISNIWLE